METTSNIGGNIVVIKIRAILLRFVAATKGSLTRYNTSCKTSVYNIQETDTLCYPCHQCWPTRSAKNRSLLISCFLVVSCSIVSISLINQPRKKNCNRINPRYFNRARINFWKVGELDSCYLKNNIILLIIIVDATKDFKQF